MVSVTSTTDQYILQPGLLSKHRQTLDYLSNAVLWKKELAFFQKLLDLHAAKFSNIDDKKEIDHFQNIILYYNGELIDDLTTRLRLHEKKLADMLQYHDETNVEYFKEHDGLMTEFKALHHSFTDFKIGFYTFIEKAL